MCPFKLIPSALINCCLWLTTRSIYVDVIVHMQRVGRLPVTVPPSSSIPGNIGPYHAGAQWYIAARYTYEYYITRLASKHYELGSGALTDYSGETYTNQPLVSGSTYAIYIRVAGTDITGVSFCTNKKLTRS